MRFQSGTFPSSSRIRFQPWVLQRHSNVSPTPEGDGLRKRCGAVVLVLVCDLFISSRFSFPTGSFKVSEISEDCTECPCLESSIELEGVDKDQVGRSWLSQANHCISGTIFKDRKRYLYGTFNQKCSLSRLMCALQQPLTS
jgi:hypothetical protein